MNRIAFATWKNVPDISADDLIAAQALRARGHIVSPAVWNDPAVDWSQFEHVVVRTTWDYHHDLPGFLNWVGKLERMGIRLHNPGKVLIGNTDKTYFKNIKRQNLVPPTLFFKKVNFPEIFKKLDEMGWKDLVIKPSISGAAKNTIRTLSTELKMHTALLETIVSESHLMIQEFIPEVQTAGECSFLFFDGEFSHAIVKHPASKDFRVQEKHGGRLELIHPSKADIQVAKDLLDEVEEDLLYARIDMIKTSKGWLLGELELTEPELFLRVDKASGARFAEAFERLLKKR